MDFHGFRGICHRKFGGLHFLARARPQAMALTPHFDKGIRMKKIAYAAFASVAALALAACGGSESAKEDATAENVEMPAEEAMSEATAAPTEEATEAAPSEAATEAAAQ